MHAISKAITLAILASLFISINGGGFELTWGTIKNFSQPAIVIQYAFSSPYKRSEWLTHNQFEYSDYVTRICIYVLDSTKNIELKTISVIAPGGNKNTYILSKVDDTKYIATGINEHIPLVFNEEGIWVIKIETNVSNALVYEYIGSPNQFNEDSKVEWLYQGIKGIEVLTPSTIQQLRAARANEKLLYWQRWAVIAMIGTAGATIILAIATFLSINESKKDKKRETIKQMILNIDTGIYEFKTLEEKVVEIDKGKIISLSEDFIRTLEESTWKDFGREFPETFDKIQEYLDKKRKYNDELEDCKLLVKEVLEKEIRNNKSWVTFLQHAMKKDKIKDNVVSFFKEEISDKLVECILLKENVGETKYVKEFFKKFEIDLLALREKKKISSKIEKLILLSHKMKQYIKLAEDLRKKRKKLMKKYTITEWEIEKTEEKLLKELISSFA